MKIFDRLYGPFNTNLRLIVIMISALFFCVGSASIFSNIYFSNTATVEFLESRIGRTEVEASLLFLQRDLADFVSMQNRQSLTKLYLEVFSGGRLVAQHGRKTSSFLSFKKAIELQNDARFEIKLNYNPIYFIYVILSCALIIYIAILVIARFSSVRTRDAINQLVGELNLIQTGILNLAKSGPDSQTFLQTPEYFELKDIIGVLANVQMKIEKQTSTISQLSAMKEREDLVRGFAHDVRSPLGAIKIVIQKYQNSIGPEAFELAQTALGRIETYCSDLLKRSRAGSDQSKISVSEFVNLIFGLLREKKLEWSDINLKTDIPDYLTNSQEKLKLKVVETLRVFSNIFNNAVEASAQNSSILVSIITDNSFLIITIQDNGTGFPKVVLEKIGDSEITYGKDDGNGIGLFNAVAVLKSYGGTLEISSSKSGSQVTLKIPLMTAS